MARARPARIHFAFRHPTPTRYTRAGRLSQRVTNSTIAEFGTGIGSYLLDSPPLEYLIYQTAAGHDAIRISREPIVRSFSYFFIRGNGAKRILPISQKPLRIAMLQILGA